MLGVFLSFIRLIALWNLKFILKNYYTTVMVFFFFLFTRVWFIRKLLIFLFSKRTERNSKLSLTLCVRYLPNDILTVHLYRTFPLHWAKVNWQCFCSLFFSGDKLDESKAAKKKIVSVKFVTDHFTYEPFYWFIVLILWGEGTWLPHPVSSQHLSFLSQFSIFFQAFLGNQHPYVF